MINEVIKLVAPRRMEMFFEEEIVDENHVVVRPKYLSICAADQRYYTGARAKEILDKKLPLALIHEAVGDVLYDPKGEFKSGDRAVLIPNTPTEMDEVIKENYLRTSKFRASSYDGFLQNVVLMKRDRIIKIGDIDFEISSLLEPISIVVNAIEEFLKSSHKRKNVLGVWGCRFNWVYYNIIIKKIFSRIKSNNFWYKSRKNELFFFCR